MNGCESDIADAAETHVRGGAVRSVRRAGCDAIAIAIGVVTEIGSAFDHFGDTGRRPDWITACCGDVVTGMEPIAAPLPSVARDAKEAVSIGRKCGDG